MKTTIIEGQEYALIELSRGKLAIVDIDVFEELSQWHWVISHSGYAVRTVKRDRKTRMFYMHRIIAKPPQGLQTDHINGNKLDNRRNNLRYATPTENSRNRPIQRTNTLGFKGVFFHRNRFEASIRAGGKPLYLGRYTTPELAAAAYNAAALKYHGEFARPSQVSLVPHDTRPD